MSGNANGISEDDNGVSREELFEIVELLHSQPGPHYLVLSYLGDDGLEDVDAIVKFDTYAELCEWRALNEHKHDEHENKPYSSMSCVDVFDAKDFRFWEDR